MYFTQTESVNDDITNEMFNTVLYSKNLKLF